MGAHIRIFGLTVLAGALLAPSLAVGQAPPHPKPNLAPRQEQSNPKDCVQSRATVGDGVDVTHPQGRDLSQQLAQSGGVICPPPRTDPAMKKPAPGGGTMPVIPPPGSPGGPHSVEPK